MSGFRPTPEQKTAIENRGGALLISAAAGSGKTKVLVERLFSRCLDRSDPRDLDEFLIITYTKAAAAELRERIGSGLAQRLREDPGNRRLRRQSLLLRRTGISTIHAFCSGLLREYAHKMEIAPDFRVADENEASLLREEALTRVLETRYEAVEPGFALLLDLISTGRDDRQLRELVLDLYRRIQAHEDPLGWLESQLGAFRDPGEEETAWERLLLDDLACTASYWALRLDQMVQRMSDCPELEEGYGPVFREDAEHLQRLSAAAMEGWDRAVEASDFDFSRLKAVKGCTDPALQATAKALRDRMKKQAVKLRERCFCRREEWQADLQAMAPAMEALAALVRDLDLACTAEKRRRSLLDFGDLEHLTLKLLTDHPSGRTEEAEEISARFAEILVDEYQDCNAVQNRIFSALSRGERNLFFVGDVKQSIYRFRLAEPGIFLEKYQAWSPAEQAKEGEPRKVLLSRNFRSRSAVLEGTNFLFRQIMSRAFGEMDYGPEESLYYGEGYAQGTDPAVEVDLIDQKTDLPEGEEGHQRTELEARFVAKRIRQLLAEGMPVKDPDTGEERPLRPSDIAILMRAPGRKARTYARMLERQGIPAASGEETEFFESTEVSVALALLALIDNPRQDVALVAVLRSPLFGFTPDQLALLRAAKPHGDLYETLKQRGGSDAPCATFLEQLERWRLAAVDRGAWQLLWQLYDETDLLALYGAMSDGARRQQNLMLLAEQARQFEAAGYKGLFSFLLQMEKMRRQEKKPLAAAGSQEQDGVQIMSIHKSKGLEFPVVFLADTAKVFNRDDMRKPVLLHTKLGLGPQCLDRERLLTYPTLARQAIAHKLDREMQAEELRVLYVAMTRAREKLIITGCLGSVEGTLRRLALEAACPVPTAALEAANSMLEWILLPLLCREEAAPFRDYGEIDSPVLYPGADLWDCRVISAGELTAGGRKAGQPEERQEPLPLPDLSDLMSRYPHPAAVEAPSKWTATMDKGRFADGESREHTAERRSLHFVRPRFLQERRGLSPAERGTATHLVMQFLDFSRTEDEAAIRQQIRELAERRIIGEEQAAAVEAEPIADFFRTELGRRLQKGVGVRREFKFSLLRPAELYFPGTEGEQILFQGVVDCYLEEDDGLTVLDFKTDRIRPGEEALRAERYRDQLEQYAAALETMTGRPVKAKWLHFFHTGKSVEIL